MLNESYVTYLDCYVRALQKRVDCAKEGELKSSPYLMSIERMIGLMEEIRERQGINHKQFMTIYHAESKRLTKYIESIANREVIAEPRREWNPWKIQFPFYYQELLETHGIDYMNKFAEEYRNLTDEEKLQVKLTWFSEEGRASWKQEHKDDK